MIFSISIILFISPPDCAINIDLSITVWQQLITIVIALMLKRSSIIELALYNECKNKLY